MPREVISTDGSIFRFREYDLPPLGPRDVRVRVTFAAPKHGTEGHSLAGSSFSAKVWDPELRLFLPREEPAEAQRPGERAIGNMVVGRVTGTGAGVRRFTPGERVYAYGAIREEHQAHEDHWEKLGSLT